MFTGAVGLAALLYVRPGPSVAVEKSKDGPDARTPPVVVEVAKDLADLKAATVFIKVTAGTAHGSGSGFLIKSESTAGYVATNHHVIGPSIRGRRAEAAGVTVVFRSGTADERSYAGVVIADDPDNDLAIVKVMGVANLPKPVNLKPANLVETLPVVVYGFPFGTKLGVDAQNPSITVTQGSVSSIRRNARNEVVAVQIDGSLNPGNSGGPILDAEGRLVGVAAATIPGAHIGLAIPAEDLNRLLDGRVGEVGVIVKATSGEVIEAMVQAPLLDPLNRVKTVRVHYLRSDRVRDNIHPDKAIDWPELAESAQQSLQMEYGMARGIIVVPAADKDRPFSLQLSFVNGSGRTIYTQPRILSFRPREPAAVDPPD
jgi:S1-C subfamily serine protease